MQMNLGVPSPRAAHAMCAVDKYLVIFGGKDAETRRNDLHIFDTGMYRAKIDPTQAKLKIVNIILSFYDAYIMIAEKHESGILLS